MPNLKQIMFCACANTYQWHSILFLSVIRHIEKLFKSEKYTNARRRQMKSKFKLTFNRFLVDHEICFECVAKKEPICDLKRNKSRISAAPKNLILDNENQSIDQQKISIEFCVCV